MNKYSASFIRYIIWVGVIMDIETKMNLIKSVIKGDGDFKKSLKEFKKLENKNKKVKK